MAPYTVVLTNAIFDLETTRDQSIAEVRAEYDRIIDGVRALADTGATAVSAAPPPADPAPVVAGGGVPCAPGRGKAAPTIDKPRSQVKAEARDAAILDVLSDGKKHRPAECFAALPNSNKATVRESIERLIDAGKVLSEGQTAGKRLWLAAESSPIKPAKADKPKAATDLDQAISSLFDAGASYDVRELTRKLRAGFPTVEVPEVQKIVLAGVQAKRIDRLETNVGSRYRKAGKAAR